MKAENLAVLLLAKQALQTKAKPKQVGTSVPKKKVDPYEGREDWVRFKSECVLLKGGKSR